MAEPISLLASTAGIVDVCIRVTIFINDLRKASDTIDEELSALEQEVQSLLTVNESIATVQKNFATDQPIDQGQPGLVKLWGNIGNLLQQCVEALLKFEGLLRRIVGTADSERRSRVDALRTALRRKSKDSELVTIRQRLKSLQDAMRTILVAIQMLQSENSHDTVSKLVSELRDQINRSEVAFQTSNGIDTTNLTSKAFRNEHFTVPRPVSSIFTGRSQSLVTIKTALLDESSPHSARVQRRFVVYGLGGAGKTQLCCKFAQDHRERFWGIFCVDASSNANARSSFVRIAKIGNVEPHMSAAKHWLSNLPHPWLLIIDSADEPDLPVVDYFPEGDRGAILMTTRNPMLQVHGTTGQKYLQLKSLETDDANELLLKAANEPSPWSVVVTDTAKAICTVLGALPLAIIHAGSAILARLCTLDTYLDYYKHSWEKIRSTRFLPSTQEDADSNLTIYSTYEIVYRGLEARGTKSSTYAVELLKLFSFLHYENIKRDMLVKAARNPSNETAAMQEESKRDAEAAQDPQSTKSWSERMQDTLRTLSALISGKGGICPLPSVLRNLDDLEYNLSKALNDLSQLSLIFYNQDDDSYSMHALVHTWVRERPATSTAEQSLYCSIAATVVAQSIALPPLGEKEGDELFRRDLLPHVNQVRNLRLEMDYRLAQNRRRRKIPFLIASACFDRAEAARAARFSRVYMQCGLWQEARILQLSVKDFLNDVAGPRHPLTLSIMLALSATYWELGRGNEAAEYQQAVLESCSRTLGNKHPKTLRVMSALGQSRWLQSQLIEARDLLENAVRGMENVLGPNHIDTLKAKGNLGRVYGKWFELHKALETHKEVVQRLETNFGPMHLETLVADDNLAMAQLDLYETLGEGVLGEAHEKLSVVSEARRVKLGKEHPYTLWAQCNLARVKSAMGQHEEAEEMMHEGIKVAIRNLGDNHIGTLFGRMYLGQILTRQKKYPEAELELQDVLRRQQQESTSRNGDHVDRIFTLALLARCYRDQAKVEKSLVAFDEAIDGLRKLGGTGHPYETRLQQEIRALNAATD